MLSLYLLVYFDLINIIILLLISYAFGTINPIIPIALLGPIAIEIPIEIKAFQVVL